MQAGIQAGVSPSALWAGRIISALVILLMLFDGVIKVLKLPAAVQGIVQLGLPESTVLPIGIGVIALICTVVYLIPRTSIPGAILLTGYLGAATATNLQVQNAWLLIPVFIGVLTWAGLYLRDERLRALIPLRSANIS